MSRNIRRRRVQGGAPTLVGFGAKPHRILPVKFLFHSVWLSLGFRMNSLNPHVVIDYMQQNRTPPQPPQHILNNRQVRQGLRHSTF